MDGVERAALSSQKHIVMNNIKNFMRHRKVTSPELELALQWLLDKTLNEELQSNWKDGYTEFTLSTIDKQANVISSKFIYSFRKEMMVY